MLQLLTRPRAAGRRLLSSLAGACPLLALSGSLAAHGVVATPTQPTNLSALHKHGQTFLTWDASVDASVESYRVYRSDAPIDAGSLGGAEFLHEVAIDSTRFYADRWLNVSTGLWDWRYKERFVITDLGPELAAGTELLVWTLQETDFGGASSGDGYYAVTSVDGAGIENTSDFAPDNALGPVAESVAAPRPILVDRVAPNDAAEIYTQFLDLREYNGTIAAPNPQNGHYGFNPSDPAIANSTQFAYNYAVFPPSTSLCPTTTGPHPLIIFLHGYGGDKHRPWNWHPNPTWCDAYQLFPVDVANTWWFGVAQDHDYRTGPLPSAGDSVTNETEARVLRMVLDLLNDPVHGPQIDPERIYLNGQSMGGSGVLSMAMRYPEVFAAAYASQPITDYASTGNNGGTNWVPDLEVKLGLIADALPVHNISPSGVADHLAAFNGTPAWDYQNQQATLQNAPGTARVPLGISHGIADDVIEWSTQGQPFYGILNDSRIQWAGGVTAGGHANSNLAFLPIPMDKTGSSDIPFHEWQVVLSETVPGISNATGNPVLPPVAEGEYNRSIEWSSSWDTWDGPPIDTPTRWEMSFRTTDGSTQFIDVTPRRCQAFEIVAGYGYSWTLERVSDGALLASGTVQADEHARLTASGIEVTPTGTRIEFRPLLEGDVATLSESLGGTQILSLQAGGDVGGDLYWVFGSLSGTSPGLPAGNLVLPLNLDAYFNLTLKDAGNAALSPSLALLDGNGDATCTFTLPPGLGASLLGLTAHHAFIVIDSTIGTVEAVSNPVGVEFVP